ncbi:hypothetical protein P7C71_g2214, partial [Lecanoromycetidae sp. Uapishka_2]
MSDTEEPSLVEGTKEFLLPGRHSDLKILCAHWEWKVHRSVICPRSKFFAAACSGDFKEAQDGIISLEDDDPFTVDRMMQYLYTMDYDDEGGGPDRPYSDLSATATATAMDLEDTKPQPTSHEDLWRYRLMSNVQVYALAEKYDIGALKKLAMVKLGAMLSSEQSCGRGKVADYMQEIIEAVFTSTPDTDRGLRDALIGACSIRLPAMLEDEVMVNVIKENGDFALGLLRASESYLRDSRKSVQSQIRTREPVALIVANNRKDEEFLSTVKGIAFLGVPHHGSGVVELGKYFAYLLRSFTRNTNAALLADLQTRSKVLSNICIDATHLICQLQVITFYETRKFPGLGRLIVDEDCARLNSPNEEAIPINADHSSVCKFVSGDANCELIGGSIVALATRIIGLPSPTKVSIQSPADNQNPKLTIHAALWADHDIKLALISQIKADQTLRIDTSYCVDTRDPWPNVHKVISILYSYEGQELNLMVTHDQLGVFSIYPGRVEPVSFIDPAVDRRLKSGSAGSGREIMAVIWGTMLGRHGPVDPKTMAKIYGGKKVECTNEFFGFDGYGNEHKTCQVFYRMKNDLGIFHCMMAREHSTIVFD